MLDMTGDGTSQTGPKANLASEGWRKSRTNTVFLQRLLAEIESILTVLMTLGCASDDWPLIKNQRISFSLLTDSRRERI